ncbi:MAG: hypothetical protein SVO96_07030 [Pseudomonadota bacterium]|nr:hypothetical protein [Pseudomonadota bacterium]
MSKLAMTAGLRPLSAAEVTAGLLEEDAPIKGVAVIEMPRKRPNTS